MPRPTQCSAPSSARTSAGDDGAVTDCVRHGSAVALQRAIMTTRFSGVRRRPIDPPVGRTSWHRRRKCRATRRRPDSCDLTPDRRPAGSRQLPEQCVATPSEGYAVLAYRVDERVVVLHEPGERTSRVLNQLSLIAGPGMHFAYHPSCRVGPCCSLNAPLGDEKKVHVGLAITRPACGRTKEPGGCP